MKTFRAIMYYIVLRTSTFFIPMMAAVFGPFFKDRKSAYRYFFKKACAATLRASWYMPHKIGSRDLPNDRPVLILYNRLSTFDPMIINYIFKRFILAFFNKYFAERFRPRTMWKVLKEVGFVFVDQESKLGGAKAVLEAKKIFDNKEAMMIYVEGDPYSDIILKVRPIIYEVLKDSDPVIIPVYINTPFEGTAPKSSARPDVWIGGPVNKEDLLKGQDIYLTGIFKKLVKLR